MNAMPPIRPAPSRASSPPLVSVVICTRNNAARLGTTLAGIAACDRPAGMAVELVVADNGSTDATAAVVAGAAATAPFPVRHGVEPRAGKGFAYNAGVRAAAGRVLLFTDDDVAVPPDWIAGMAEPILSGRADAVAGAVVLGPAVDRPWMTVQHRSWLASTERLDPAGPQDMVGANMAFDRRVFDRVPAFDPELGPGALGFADEALFAFQVLAAGLRLVMAAGVVVTHHPDPGRLRYANWIDMAERQGRSAAYVCYHWQHLPVRLVPAKRAVARAGLAWGRMARRWRRADPEQADPRELAAVTHLAFLRQYARMRGHPRHYDRRGLVKVRGVMP